MIRAVVLLGAETVELYGRTGKIPENNFEESGGYMTVREFETKAEYDAYVAGMEDHDGHEDWRMITVQDSPDSPFHEGDLVRLTDEAVETIRLACGGEAAEYRRQMILEVKSLEWNENVCTARVTDIREDDEQVVSVACLRRLTADDLRGMTVKQTN